MLKIQHTHGNLRIAVNPGRCPRCLRGSKAPAAQSHSAPQRHGQGCMDRRDRSRSAVLLMGGPDGRKPVACKLKGSMQPSAAPAEGYAKGANAVGGGRGPRGPRGRGCGKPLSWLPMAGKDTTPPAHRVKSDGRRRGGGWIVFPCFGNAVTGKDSECWGGVPFIRGRCRIGNGMSQLGPRHGHCRCWCALRDSASHP